MVRTGIAIYGYPHDAAAGGGLAPVMALKSHLARIHQVLAGGSVSYGRTWTAERPTTVGLVMAGYGDGLPRLLSSSGSAIIAGRRVPIIGRVCMDQCIVDLTAVPDATIGQEMVLVGHSGREFIGADDIAGLSGTISYEVLTGVAARVPRLFLRGGKVIEVQTLNATLTA